jgi:hypothetical protein
MNRKLLRPVALLLAVNIIAEVVAPTVCYALTGGPSQPEMESFEPAATTDMVDLFTGDFNYNIPLFDVGGYPVNIAYHSGITMDQEASWTGLGWNINAGVINRAVRGLPDDFKGDEMHYETNMQDNNTWGINAALNFELMGKKGVSNGTLNIALGVTQNNYRGLGLFFGANYALPNAPFKIGIGAGSQSGFDYDVSYSHKFNQTKKGDLVGGVGVGIGSRAGFKGITVNLNRGQNKKARWIDQRSYNNTFPMSPSSELPTISNSFTTRIQNYNISFGVSVWGLHPGIFIGGTYSSTKIADAIRTRNAYGYMYANAVGTNPDAIQDFSRERDGTFGTSTKYLPVSSPSYDLLNVSGQGTGGIFRAHRNNVGIYHDPHQEVRASNWGNLGIEIGTFPSFHLGLNYTPTVGIDKTGVWDEDHGNQMDNFHFGYDTTNFNEGYYFQAAGEKVPMDMTRYNDLAGEEAARLDIDGLGLNYYATLRNKLKTIYDPEAGEIKRFHSGRRPRVQLISMLTAGEAASGLGMMPAIRSYTPGPFDTSAYTNIARNTIAKNHHIGEITQTNPDGSRYIYAIPAYNTSQEEVSFSVQHSAIDYSRGLTEYASGDNTVNNSKGTDHFFNKVKTSPYAHSYLLTAVLSPNYADADHDGKPSPGDVGDYVIFHYTRHDQSYRWRVPVEASKAHYQENLKSDPQDDKANYIYGTKEIWYLHTIESRTHIAEFKTSPRKDGLGVTGPDGGKDNAETLLKLDTIILFAKPDRLLNGDRATPVKKVVFEYDYSLCKNVPNNVSYGLTGTQPEQLGKLTLKKLYFVYGNSSKGAMSPYTFNYGFNPDYNMANYDRWGNYKPNDPDVPNRDFPYVDQDLPRDTADKYASAWNLEQVNLPSGGIIKVNYESDDYAYVQDWKAMQMVKVIGATDKNGLAKYDRLKTYDKLYENVGESRYDYLVFEIPKGITTPQELKQKCFSNVTELYFKFLVQIRNKQEYVSGWCSPDLNEIGFTGNDPNYGYVKIKLVDQGDWLFNKSANVHPISKASWQFAMAHMSKVLHPGSEPANTGVSAFQGLMESFGEALDMFRGQYQALKVKNVASRFVPGKSWIRIESSDLIKYGGGCRVKELSFTDSWADMDESDKTASYDQVYDYTIEDEEAQRQGYDRISSGVAAYEPLIGGEEIPLRQPLRYFKDPNLTLPALELYNEMPFGESFFPPAGVGYRKVTVKRKPKTGVERTGTGSSEYEFYTAKDFPVKVSSTPMFTQSRGSGLWGSTLSTLMKVVQNSYYAGSQGYSIKVNDMHGKPKATSIYSQSADHEEKPLLISRVSYEYQVKGKELDNNVKVMTASGDIEDAVIGKEIDVSVDLRENESKQINGGLEINLEFAALPAVAWSIPYPKFSYNLKRMQSASVTKVIQQFGILKSTTVQDEGSVIKTSNLLYDKVTGNVLLTQTSNTFNDPVYQFNYPAHMAYDGMGAAYKNTGAAKHISIGAYGLTGNTTGYFTEGDEVALYDTASWQLTKAWVLQAEPTEAVLIGANGTHIIPGNFLAKIIRSGRKNMLTANVGELVTMKNPITSSDSVYFDPVYVVQATANTFQNTWPMRELVKNPVYDCNFIADTFVMETFDMIMEMVERQQNGISYTLPYSLSSFAWYANSKWIPKFQAIHNVSTECIDNMTIDFRIGGSSVPDWYDQDTIDLMFNGPCSPSPLTGLRLTSGECTLVSVDHFFSVVPGNTGTGAGGARGTAYAITTGGDTCTFTYGPATGGLYDNYSGYVAIDCELINCSYTLNGPFNPFLSGDKGLWMPHRQKAFIDDRSYSYASDTTAIRTDGKYANFSPYWQFQPDGLMTQSNDKRWVNASTITRYSKRGQPLEAMDALGNSSAELYGYEQNFVTASSSYARAKDIGNDNFEEYQNLGESCGTEDHWSFRTGTDDVTSVASLPYIEDDIVVYAKSFITPKQAHSGTQSLCIPPGHIRIATRYIDTSIVVKPEVTSNGYYESHVKNTAANFRPDPGKKYVVSAWVKGRATDVNLVDHYDSCWIRVKTTGSNVVLLNTTFKPSGPVIEGWQRVEGVFSIHDSADYISVSLENQSRYKAYVDDIRIHPFESNMRTFVYHPVLLKVMAILDENNFATFYEYDQEGKLVRIKKETVKGIMTVQESRSGIKKPLNP